MIGTRPARPARLSLESLEDRSVPATFNVTTAADVIDPADGKRSLREAITAANNLAGADVIVVPAGVYKIALAGTDENSNATGDFDIRGEVKLQGAGAGITIIDAQQLDRVIDVVGSSPSSIKVVLQGMTIRNGDAGNAGGGIRIANADLVVRDAAVTGNRTTFAGGGVSNGGAEGTGNVTIVRTVVSRNIATSDGGGLCIGVSTLTIRNSTVRRNVAGNNGGGLLGGTVVLANSEVSGNIAATDGGGIRTSGTATLTDSAVTGNMALSSGGIGAASASLTRSTVSGNAASAGIGGGIRANSEVTLNASTVSRNSAVGNISANGGGVNAPTVTLTDSTVSDNVAGGSGGGIDATTANLIRSTVRDNMSLGAPGGGIRAIGSATLTASTVSGNWSINSGGGIRAAAANLTRCTVSGNSTLGIGGGVDAIDLTLTNSTVSGNSAGGNGGGVHAAGGVILNCTIAENVGGGGGGAFELPDPTRVLIVRNTIIALNLLGSGALGADVLGGFLSAGHNIIGVGTGSTAFNDGTAGDTVGTVANPIDPKLGPLANNGGKTKTHALLPGSRAIDRGDNANLPPTDQRGAGFPRKKDGNGDGVARVDIGAFER